MPRVSDHLVKSAIRLLRQSTTVPNTSNTRAFTAETSDIVRTFCFRHSGAHAPCACEPGIQRLLIEIPGSPHWAAQARPNGAPRNDGVGLQHLPVLDESQIVRDLVVQRAGLRVARLRQLVDAAGACRFGLAVNLFDQGASQAAAARIFRHVKILKVAVAVMRPGRTMEQVMCDAEQ